MLHVPFSSVVHAAVCAAGVTVAMAAAAAAAAAAACCRRRVIVVMHSCAFLVAAAGINLIGVHSLVAVIVAVRSRLRGGRHSELEGVRACVRG